MLRHKIRQAVISADGKIRLLIRAEVEKSNPEPTCSSTENINTVTYSKPDGRSRSNEIKMSTLVPLPFADAVFDEIDIEFVLERLPSHEVQQLLKEVKRILSPSGRIRLTTADLEGRVRWYLQSLREQRGSTYMLGRHSELSCADSFFEMLHGISSSQRQYQPKVFKWFSWLPSLFRQRFVKKSQTHLRFMFDQLSLSQLVEQEGFHVVEAASDESPSQDKRIVNPFRATVSITGVLHDGSA